MCSENRTGKCWGARTPAEDPCYARHAPEVRLAFERFCSGGARNDACDEKTRALMTVALASVFRCPQLVQAHADRAIAAGASKEDVAEALLIAAAAGAGSHTRLTREVYDGYLDRLLAHFERLQR